MPLTRRPVEEDARVAAVFEEACVASFLSRSLWSGRRPSNQRKKTEKRRREQESARGRQRERERENRGKQNNKLKDYEAFAVERVRERVCK